MLMNISLCIQGESNYIDCVQSNKLITLLEPA